MVRVRSRPVANCGGYALVTVDVEPAAERSVTVAEDFITAPGPYRELYAAELADEALVADLTGGALDGVLDALTEYEYRTGPLRVVLVEHYLNVTDSGYGSVREAAARAVRQAIDLLPHRMVREWVTDTPGGPVVRLTNPVRPPGRYRDRGAEVTVEVAPAPQRTVTVGVDFAASAAGSGRSADESAQAVQAALVAAHTALDRYEAAVGPLRLVLVAHRPGDGGARWMDVEYKVALDAGVRMAVEQLAFALGKA